MLYGVLAYVSWGVIPAYLKLLSHLPVVQVLFHRSLWAFVFFGLVLLFSKKFFSGVFALTTRQRWVSLATSVLLGINWGVYLYAVNSNQVIESSLGYFINPLINMVLGTLILKENLSPTRRAAVALAALGVLWLTFLAGHFPWIGLSLGLTFGFYGLLRKTAKIPPTTALQVESLILSVAMLFLFWHFQPGQTIFSTNPKDALLLMGSGFATGIPLYWFSKAVQSTPLNVLGFLQFISPTGQFLLGAFLYKEPFPTQKLIGFALIWSGVLVLLVELTLNRARRKSSQVGENV